MNNENFEEYFQQIYRDKEDPWGMKRSNQRRRLQFYIDCIKKVHPKKIRRGLEIACGDGLLAKELLKCTEKLDVADKYPEMIEKAKENLKEEKRIQSYIINKLPNLNFRKKYDAVFCIEAIYYLKKEEEQKFYNNIHKIIRKKGLLVITSETGRAKYDKKNFEKVASFSRNKELFGFTDKIYAINLRIKVLLDIIENKNYLKDSKNKKIQIARKIRRVLSIIRSLLMISYLINKKTYESKTIESIFYYLGRMSGKKIKDELIIYRRK